mmetsp:Transcript_27812/g.79878  ORF Transcript_27812/g.79878 Transcript_27812/m.79878 type:complete len:576 (+) Transcript_27812:111-1838(+)
MPQHMQPSLVGLLPKLRLQFDQSAAELDGRAQHAGIEKERWCVTKKDLQCFRNAVRKSINLGLIQPTQKDPFNLATDAVGPNVYTVNDQFIKPISALFGDTSFALLWHPHGLKCDLFITHAWIEGAFEFVDRVLTSWPTGTNHAYCCMLSNPQNLDISDLISSPSDSPFAAALQAAHTMVALPNQTSSIYGRLWCVYEAHLACESGMLIKTATRSSHPRVWPMAIAIAALSLGGAALGRLYHSYGIADSYADELAFAAVGNVPLALSLSVAGDRSSLICNCVGAVAGGFYWNCTDSSDLIVCFSFVYIAYYVLSEFDRARRAEVRTSLEQLTKGFSGSVRDAQCSSLADHDAIWSAIGDKVTAVDHSIDVLRSAGMSTPSLRDASLAGVPVKNAGLMEFAFLALKYPTSIYFSWGLLCFDSLLMVCLAVMMLLVELVWTALLMLLQRDRRALHLMIAYKLFMLALPCIVLARLGVASPLVPLRSPKMALWCGLLLCPLQALGCCLSLLGVSGIVRIAGPRFARLLVARGFVVPDVRCCHQASSCPSSSKSAGASGSASPEEETGGLDWRNALPGA